MSVAEIEARELQLEAPSGLWNEAWYRLVRNPAALLGGFFVTVFVTVAVFAPLIAPYGPKEHNLDLSRTAIRSGRRPDPVSASTCSSRRVLAHRLRRPLLADDRRGLRCDRAFDRVVSVGRRLSRGFVDTVIMRCMT